MPPAAFPLDPASPEARAALALQRRWVQALDDAAREQKDFLDDGKRVVERYRNEATRGKTRKRGMSILYANTETLGAALFSQMGKPDVRRMFSDRDPLGQTVAAVIERALTYADKDGAAQASVEAAVQDMLLPGRGTVRVEYEPVIGQRQATDPLTGAPLFDKGEDGTPTPAMVDFLADQRIHLHYVYWRDVLLFPARRWMDVPAVAFRHVFDRAALEEEVFGTAGPDSEVYATPDSVPLDWMPEGSDPGTPRGDTALRRAEVWEVWDRVGERRLWICKSAAVPLRVDPDPYGLEGFFPLPEPLTAYRTNDSIVPQAPYKAYEDQAEDLDELTRRISILTKALKRRGVYNQAIPELKRLASANDNEYIGTPNFAALMSSGGLEDNFLTEDIRPIAAVLVELMKQRDAQVQAIYEITGISDILRGSTDPDETATAQSLKAQTGSTRLRRMQGAVQRFVRDLYRIQVDLMCRHFEPQTLGAMVNMPITPDIMAVLQSDQMRGYKVDVETDSTVFQDAAAQQQARSQLLQGVTQLWQAWAPIVAQRPQLAALLFSLTEFGIAPARDARQVQEAIEKAQADLAAQPQQPPGAQTDPAALAKAQQAQAQAQAAQTKAAAEQAKGQTAVQVAQIQAQGVAAKAQADLQSTTLQVQQQREAHAQDMLNAQAKHEQAMAQAAQAHEAAMRRQALSSQAPAAPDQSRPSSGGAASLPGAQQAPDGQFYVRLPHAGGQFHRVVPRAA